MARNIDLIFWEKVPSHHTPCVFGKKGFQWIGWPWNSSRSVPFACCLNIKHFRFLSQSTWAGSSTTWGGTPSTSSPPADSAGSGGVWHSEVQKSKLTSKPLSLHKVCLFFRHPGTLRRLFLLQERILLWPLTQELWRHPRPLPNRETASFPRSEKDWLHDPSLQMGPESELYSVLPSDERESGNIDQWPGTLFKHNLIAWKPCLRKKKQ